MTFRFRNANMFINRMGKFSHRSMVHGLVNCIIHDFIGNSWDPFFIVPQRDQFATKPSFKRHVILHNELHHMEWVYSVWVKHWFSLSKVTLFKTLFYKYMYIHGNANTYMYKCKYNYIKREDFKTGGVFINHVSVYISKYLGPLYSNSFPYIFIGI